MAFYTMKEYVEYTRHLANSKRGLSPDFDYFEIRNNAPRVSKQNGDNEQEGRNPKLYTKIMEEIERMVRNKKSPVKENRKLKRSSSITPTKRKIAPCSKRKSSSTRKSLAPLYNHNIDTLRKKKDNKTENSIDSIISYSIGTEIKFLILFAGTAKKSDWHGASGIVEFFDSKQQLDKLTNFFYKLKSNFPDKYEVLSKAIKANEIYESLEKYLVGDLYASS